MPRARPRKRLSRMDAAVDAMVPFGFPEDKVKKHVKQLLKVYGDDGWPFIEEYSYKELIDAMLRDIQEDGEEEDQVEMCPEDEGGSGNIIRNEGPKTNYPENIAKPRSPEFASNPSRTNHNIVDNAVRHNVDELQLQPPSKLQPTNGYPPLRRTHCYGWIESDDEKDVDDFLVLKSAHAALGPKADVPREDHIRFRNPSDWNKTHEKKTKVDLGYEKPDYLY